MTEGYLYGNRRISSGNYLSIDGGTMNGQIDMNNNTIINIPNPVESSQAANKQYVDSKINYFTTTIISDNWQDNSSGGYVQNISISNIQRIMFQL